MNINQQIEQDYLQAYKAKDEARVSLLRLLKSSLKNAEISKMAPLDAADAIKVIQKEVKQREDAVKESQKGERADLAEKDQKEIGMLKNYLPAEMSDEELNQIIDSAINEVQAKALADFGRVMGAVMPKIAGRAGGDRVSALVHEKLS